MASYALYGIPPASTTSAPSLDSPLVRNRMSTAYAEDLNGTAFNDRQGKHHFDRRGNQTFRWESMRGVARGDARSAIERQSLEDWTTSIVPEALGLQTEDEKPF